MPTLKPLGALLNAPDYADRVNLIQKTKSTEADASRLLSPNSTVGPKTRCASTARLIRTWKVPTPNQAR